MTKEEFNKKTDRVLTPAENALININIYYNPDHITYYMNFNIGNYEWCYDYLIANRHLLVIDHTPYGLRSTAKEMIKAAKVYYKK